MSVIQTTVEIKSSQTVINTEADEILAWLNSPNSSVHRLPDGTWCACDLTLPKESIAFGSTIAAAITACRQNIEVVIENWKKEDEAIDAFNWIRKAVLK